MPSNNIKSKISKLIFGKDENISFHRRLFILLASLTMIFFLLASLSNILLDLDDWTVFILLIGFGLVTFFYLKARNSRGYEKTIVPVFLLSIALFSCIWFVNGGYESGILSHILLYFFMIYMLVPEKLRFTVFLSYLAMFIILFAVQYYYPDSIVDYNNEQQRILDLFISGLLGFIFLYAVIDMIVRSFEKENKKIEEMNSELQNKNTEIEKSNSELQKNSERLSLALLVSRQAWFDLDLVTGGANVSDHFPTMLGYDPKEYSPNFQNWQDSIIDEDREKTLATLNESLITNTTISLKYRIKTKSGSWKWIQSTGKIVEYTDDGKPKRMIGTHLDISELMQAELALRESEEKYRALVDNAWEGITILDMNGTVLFANRSIAHTFGIKDTDTLIGRKVFDFIAPESIPLVMQDFTNVMQGNDSYTSVYKCYALDGTELWLESIGKAIHYEGEIADLVSLRDITERRAVEQELRDNEEKYRNLFNTMPNGFYRSTPEGYFIDANPALVEMLGYYSLDELKKVHIPTTIYVNEEERYDMDEYNTDFISELEIYRLRRKDGTIIWLEDNARYVKDEYGNIIYHEGICKDITDRLRKDAELKESEARLKELNATKDKFFSIIAHDLKNPLGNFRNIANVLYDQYDYFNEPDKKEYIKAIKDASEQVYELLENLLDWSRSQRGKIVFCPDIIDLYFISISCIGALKLSAANKNIKLVNNITIGSICYADANLVTTVMRNLTSNAIKFTPKDGTIEIGIIDPSDNDSSMVTVYVKDNGVGISQEIKDKLFRIDQNVTTPGTSQEKGTGLGLILCKEFIEMHKGRIWVDSQQGIGSTFYFTVPKEDTGGISE
jgi:PAS domain S-box-containing protein